jgi:uncharacterized protein YbjT (DUF2867 family)
MVKGSFGSTINQSIMKFIATGSLGKIGLPLTSLLVNEGHQVVVISSNSQHIGRIEALGAKAAIGSVLDSHFLTGVFEGADAIYTMVPPNWVVGDYRQYIAEVGHRYEEAIRASGVKRVVNLSSIGADLDGGNGPIAGLHDVETRLNGLIYRRYGPWVLWAATMEGIRNW